MEVQVKCEECGADIEFKPGTSGLTCNYCDHYMEFEESPSSERANEELDLESYLDGFDEQNEHVDRHVISCSSCGAETAFEENQQATSCAFCDTPLVITQAHSARLIKPQSLLPFQVQSTEAKNEYKTWVHSLWFAPNDLKKQVTQSDKFKGVYLPYWTYDCETSTNYVGQRGDYYYQTITVQNSDGKSEKKQIRKVRWRMVSGYVDVDFDDILVPATTSLPRSKLYDLEPWDLEELVDYKDEFLTGYLAESYHLNLKEGYSEAKEIMDDRIKKEIHYDIGGDEQRIFSSNSQYYDATFKHVLLPVWISAYRYKGKLYQILVNGRTGEVQGERPYSWVKITCAVIASVVAVGATLYLYNQYQ